MLSSDEQPTPFLVIDLDAARRNIRATLDVIGTPERWRPHVKTAKVPELMGLYLEAGLARFKCATLLEAETLAACRPSAGAPRLVKGSLDILVAHHLFGPALRRLEALADEHSGVRFSTLVESEAQVPHVPSGVGIFLDLDLGMHRTGLDVEAREEIAAIAALAGERFRGLHAYDGHRHELDAAERERLAHADYDRLIETVRHLEAQGLAPEEIITSGTPAYPAALTHAGLASLPHRVSPGTVIYHDLRTREQLAGHAIEFAATVRTRVASLPSTDLFTVDAGSKAIEAARPDLIASALEIPEAVAIRQSEEHTVFRCPASSRPERGTLLTLIPGHVCPTVNLASRCFLTQTGKAPWVVPVAARGH